MEEKEIYDYSMGNHHGKRKRVILVKGAGD